MALIEQKGTISSFGEIRSGTGKTGYTWQRQNIVIDYRDNGKGFNLEEVESVGMGLSNIKSRISSLGGKIRFDSKPGSGMLAHIEVSTTGEIVQLAEDLYEQVYGKRYGRKKSKRSVGR